MNSITPDDCECLLDCIGELHSFRDASGLVNWLLDTALPSLVPSDWLSYNEVDLSNPANTMAILKPEPITLFLPLFGRFQELAHQNPLIARQMTATNFPVHKISDFYPRTPFTKRSCIRKFIGRSEWSIKLPRPSGWRPTASPPSP